jgi:hypothetical protein
MPPDAVLAQSPRDPGQHRECMSSVWHILCFLRSVATCGFDSRQLQAFSVKRRNDAKLGIISLFLQEGLQVPTTTADDRRRRTTDPTRWASSGPAQ